MKHKFTSILVILLIMVSVASLFLGDLLDGIFISLIVILWRSELFRQKSQRRRANYLGGASRRPAYSGIGAPFIKKLEPILPKICNKS